MLFIIIFVFVAETAIGSVLTLLQDVGVSGAAGTAIPVAACRQDFVVSNHAHKSQFHHNAKV